MHAIMSEHALRSLTGQMLGVAINAPDEKEELVTGWTASRWAS